MGLGRIATCRVVWLCGVVCGRVRVSQVAKNGSRHWRGGIQLARGASQQSGRRRRPSWPDPRGPRVGNRHAHRQLRLSEQNAAVLWRPGRSERSRQTAIGIGEVRTFGLHLQIWRHDDFGTRSNCYGSCCVVVWSVFRACGRQLFVRQNNDFCDLSGLLWTLRDCMMTISLAETV